MLTMTEATIGAETALGWPNYEDDASAIATVRIERQRQGDVTCVRILREVRCGDVPLAQVAVWSRTLSHVAAECLFQVLECLGSDLFPIADLAAGLPTYHVDTVLDRLVEAEVQKKRAADAEAEEAARKAREALRIGVFYTGSKKKPILEMRRGSRETFFDIGFGAEWERERFWDWLKWQTEHFEDIAVEVATHGAERVRIRLLHDMLLTEQAVRKRGLGAGGRRPLVFWRGEA